MTVLSRMYSQSLLRNSSRLTDFLIKRQPVRSFRTKRMRKRNNEPEPYEAEIGSSESPGPGILGKYFVYTAVAVPAFFTGCAIWQYETFRNVVRHPSRNIKVDSKQYSLRDHVNAIWNQIPPARQLVIEIVAANIAIFLLWRAPVLQPVLTRYFVCMPTKAHSVVSSTLSAFSHLGGFHLFANMYVLWSFSAPLALFLGKEQFLAIYLAGGTIAGLTSSVFRVMSGKLVPSVGASGAILSFIAITCLQFPDSRLSIAFVDQVIPHSFSAKSALVGLVVLDCIGIVRGWRFLDHAGHLGGALFGMWYYKYGRKLVWQDYKQAFLKKYHSYRNGKK